MLLYQNASASEGSLFGYFSDDPAILSLIGELAAENREIGLSQIEDKPLPLKKAERLLAINKELRKLYDTTASRYLKGFDATHTPAMGWEYYLTNNS